MSKRWSQGSEGSHNERRAGNNATHLEKILQESIKIVKQKKDVYFYWTRRDLEEKLHTKSATLLWMCFVASHLKFFHMCLVKSVFYADLPLPSSADDPLAVSGASDGRHTRFVRVVNDEHEPAAFWCKHPNLTVIPGCKTVEGLEIYPAVFFFLFTFSNKDAAMLKTSD